MQTESCVRLLLYCITVLYPAVYCTSRVSYRVAPPPHSKATAIGADLVGAAMWWWVLWHLWHEYEHITVSILKTVWKKNFKPIFFL